MPRLAATHCKRGHAFTPDNSYVRPNGSRNCKACKQVRMHEVYLRLKANKPSPLTVALNRRERDEAELYKHVLSLYRPPEPCPKCLRLSSFAPVSGRKSLACYQCGNNVSPLADSKIFLKTRVSLTAWRTAYMLLRNYPHITTHAMAHTIGYPYKTAYRIRQQLLRYPSEAEYYLS